MAKRKASKTTSKPTVKRAKIKTSKTEKPFRLLNLPAELRDMIYACIVETDTPARLDRRNKGKLIVISAMSQTSKQVRQEITSATYLYAPIVADVRNLDFRHIVTFFNKLSDLELRYLSGTTANNNPERKITIELFFTQDYKVGSSGPFLDRWLNRIEHPTKKGTKVDFSYSVVNDDVTSLRSWVNYQPYGRGAELGKIIKALRERLVIRPS